MCLTTVVESVDEGADDDSGALPRSSSEILAGGDSIGLCVRSDLRMIRMDRVMGVSFLVRVPFSVTNGIRPERTAENTGPSNDSWGDLNAGIP